MKYAMTKKKLREMSDLASITAALESVAQRLIDREDNPRPSSSVISIEGGETELVAGMATQISARTKASLENGVRRGKSASLLTKRLAGELFTCSELAASNVKGHGDRPPLDAEKVAAICSFIMNAFPNETEGHVNLFLNQKCADSRKSKKSD